MTAKGEKTMTTEKLSELLATILSVTQTLYEVVAFLAVAIGFILQDIWYKVVGYPIKELTGELALVTGGGGGLGRQIATRLCKLGVNVVLWDINQEGIDETAKILTAMGGKCWGYRVDISNKEEVYKAGQKIRRDAGDVTMLINNAGVVSGRALLDTPDQLIERSFNVNVLAHFWTTKAFLPAMLEKDHGHIVTIASLAGHVGISKLIDYCSTKFAAVGFDEALRLELDSLGSQGIFTTLICPYFIQSTGMFEDVNAKWVPTLSSNDVADRIIDAIRKNEKIAVMPSYLQFMLALKWIVPWGCVAAFLKRLVPDATPQHAIAGVLSAPVLSGSAKIEQIANVIDETTAIDNNNTGGTSLLMHRVPQSERAL